MSTFVKLLPPGEVETFASLRDEPAVEPEQSSRIHTGSWTLEGFAEEQIRGLVRQVFLPGWPKPCRQVVFSGVDQGTDTASICMQVGQALVNEGSGAVCVVETCGGDRSANAFANARRDATDCEKRFGALRESAEQLSSSLWFMSQKVFLGANESGLSTAWLRARLAELRLEFEYTVLQGPAASTGNEAAMLGATCDGLVLVLQANATRRATAQRVKETIHAANARLLGTVLSERTFPIPSSIYRRL